MGKIATKKKLCKKQVHRYKTNIFIFFGIQKTDKKNTQYKTHTHTHMQIKNEGEGGAEPGEHLHIIDNL